jgi:signal transduction histidine kinase
VFTNLLTNAFEALGGQGTISIRAAADALAQDPGFASDAHAPLATVVVEVVDDGPGVAVELSDRIFDPFFTTKPQGSGLGLAIVRKIVDAHDGRIDVGERAGGGTAFRVTLPVRSQQQLFG